MQTQQPIAFEISIERRTELPAPAIKQRLEQSPSRKQLSLDEVQRKIDLAAKARQARIEKHISDLAAKTENKKLIIRERRISEERAVKEKMSQRINAASEKHTVHITSIQDKARTHNQRVVKAIETLTTKETEQAETRRSVIMERQKKAEEKRQARCEEIRKAAVQSYKPKGNSSMSPMKSQTEKMEQ